MRLADYADAAVCAVAWLHSDGDVHVLAERSQQTHQALAEKVGEPAIEQCRDFRLVNARRGDVEFRFLLECCSPWTALARRTPYIAPTASPSKLSHDLERGGIAERFERLGVRRFPADLRHPKRLADPPPNLGRKLAHVVLAGADPAHRLRLVLRCPASPAIRHCLQLARPEGSVSLPDCRLVPFRSVIRRAVKVGAAL
jgi:hypothetical protein